SPKTIIPVARRNADEQQRHDERHDGHPDRVDPELTDRLEKISDALRWRAERCENAAKHQTRDETGDDAMNAHSVPSEAGGTGTGLTASSLTSRVRPGGWPAPAQTSSRPPSSRRPSWPARACRAWPRHEASCSACSEHSAPSSWLEQP